MFHCSDDLTCHSRSPATMIQKPVHTMPTSNLSKICRFPVSAHSYHRREHSSSIGTSLFMFGGIVVAHFAGHGCCDSTSPQSAEGDPSGFHEEARKPAAAHCEEQASCAEEVPSSCKDVLKLDCMTLACVTEDELDLRWLEARSRHAERVAAVPSFDEDRLSWAARLGETAQN